MKIVQLNIKNFRSYTNESFRFDDINEIYGRNGSGKSTLAEAILWCLYGVDMLGTTKQESRLMRDKGTIDEMRVGVSAVCSGKSVTVERIEPVDGSPVLYVNGKKSGQAAVDVWFNKKDTFLSAFLPGYFGNLEPKDGRKILADLLQTPPAEYVLAQLSKPERNALADDDLLDVERLLESKRKALKQAEGDLQVLMGRAQEAQEQAKRAPITFEGVERLAQVQTLLAQSANVATPKQSTDVTAFKQMQQSLRQQYKSIYKLLKEIPKEPKCTECGSPLSPEKAKDVKGKVALHNAHTEAQMQEIAAKGKEIAAKIQAIEAENAKIAEYNAKLQVSSVVDVTALQAEKDALMQKKAEVTVFNNGIETAKTRYAELVSSVRAKQTEINVLKQKVAALQNYRVAFAEMQIAQLVQHLKNTKIVLFDVTKETGEIKPVFRLTWKGRPYRSLSTSEKVRCDIEVHNMINAVIGDTIPLFVNDADLILDLFDECMTGQIFAEYARKEDLRIESYPVAMGETA